MDTLAQHQGVVKKPTGFMGAAVLPPQLVTSISRSPRAVDDDAQSGGSGRIETRTLLKTEEKRDIDTTAKSSMARREDGARITLKR